jgi:hypothetical protein
MINYIKKIIRKIKIIIKMRTIKSEDPFIYKH